MLALAGQPTFRINTVVIGYSAKLFISNYDFFSRVTVSNLRLRVVNLHTAPDPLHPSFETSAVYRACKSRARKRGWGQLGAGGLYTPC